MNSPRTQVFTVPDIWSGGNYELKIYLGPPSEERIRTALESVWQYPAIEGPYANRDLEPADQDRLTSPTDRDHVFGRARMRDIEIPCGTFVTREASEQGEPNADFLSFYVPLSALGLIYPIGPYPFGGIEDSAKWRPAVDAWFLHMLQSLNIDFQVAVIGWEAELMLRDVIKLETLGVPHERYQGIVLPTKPRLEWHPPTRYDSLFDFPQS